MILDDATTGARGVPNSVCYEKLPESPIVEYKLNGSGYRAGMESSPKRGGVYRIVMTGSSMAMGEHVQQWETFAARLPNELSQKTGRKVEVYNEAMGWGFTHSVTLRFKDVLAAEPDLVLWVVMAGDVDRSSDVLAAPEEAGEFKSKNFTAHVWMRLHTVFATESVMKAIADAYLRSRTALMVRHYLYQSESLYVQAVLRGDESGAGFMRDPLSAHWEEQLKHVDSDAATIEAQARAAGVPFVAVYLPNRVQAVMVSMGQSPTGVDPYQLDNRLRPIIESHGGTYIDMLPEFRQIPGSERFFFPVDGHLNPEGHEVVSSLLARELTSGVVPALEVNDQTSAGAGDSP